MRALHVLGWLSVAVFILAAATENAWLALGAGAGWMTGIAIAWRSTREDSAG